MDIYKINRYEDRLLEALNDLLPQLAPEAETLDRKTLEKIIASENSHLLVAEEDGRFCGSLTLVVDRIPTGLKAWIEDVVVDRAFRGRGIGRSLTEEALALAKKLGVKSVNLTSSPSREAANALYKKVGFELRETNVYRYHVA